MSSWGPIDVEIPEHLRLSSLREATNEGEEKVYLWGLSNKARRHTTYKRARCVIGMAPIFRGQTVLDVGCGWGYVPILLSRMGVRPIGLDCVLDLARVSDEVTAANGLSAEYVCGDARHLPFPDASFDVVMQMETLEHVGDAKTDVGGWDDSISEMARVVKPGGTVIISTPNVHGFAQVVKTGVGKLPVLRRRYGLDHCVSPGRIVAAAESCGLSLAGRRNCLITVPFAPDALFPVNLAVEWLVERLAPLRSIATTSIFAFRKGG